MSSLSTKLTICAWNINTDRRVEQGFAKHIYPEYKYTARHGHIMTHIKSINADILCLTELSDISTALVVPELEKLGYNVVVHRYCDDRDAFTLLVAYRGEFLASLARYFNVHPESPTTRPVNFHTLTDKSEYTAQNFGQEFERSALMCLLKRGSEKIVVCCLHPAINQTYNVKSMEMLPGFVDEFISKHELAAETPVIIAGDLNTIN